MNNNHGQSLVLFVLIIPIFILIIMAIIDIGKVALLKSELDDINYITLEYGLDNLDKDNLENKLEDMIRKNNENLDTVKIEINEQKINITIENRVDLIIIKNSNIFNIESSYVGYLDNDKKIIERA